MANELRDVPIDQIQPSSHQARKEFRQESLKALAESLKQEGVIQPIVIRTKGDGEGGGARYELISGERRWRAAKLLGWKTIEAKVITTASEGEAAAKGLVENLQREDLNPIEEAEGFDDLLKIDPNYWTQNRVGDVVGEDQAYISRSLALLRLPVPIQENMRRRIFSRSHGIELLRLKAEELQIKASKQIVSKELSIKETRNLIDQMLGGKAKKKKASGMPKMGNLGVRFTEAGPALKITGFFLKNMPIEDITKAVEDAYQQWRQNAPDAGSPSGEVGPAGDPDFDAIRATWEGTPAEFDAFKTAMKGK